MRFISETAFLWEDSAPGLFTYGRGDCFVGGYYWALAPNPDGPVVRTIGRVWAVKAVTGSPPCLRLSCIAYLSVGSKVEQRVTLSP